MQAQIQLVWSPEMTTHRAILISVNDVDHPVASIIKLCYYLAIQIWKHVFAVLYEVYYGCVQQPRSAFNNNSWH
jgi:hypothetical protein